MAKVQDRKTITIIVALAVILAFCALVYFTVNYIDPFMSNDSQGNPTFFGRCFLFVLYGAEFIVGLIVSWMSALAVWSLFPVKKNKFTKNAPISPSDFSSK